MTAEKGSTSPLFSPGEKVTTFTELPAGVKPERSSLSENAELTGKSPQIGGKSDSNDGEEEFLPPWKLFLVMIALILCVFCLALVSHFETYPTKSRYALIDGCQRITRSS